MDKQINISNRLKQVASFVSKGAFLADIGSDHAYLPAYICTYDSTLRAIAGEVRQGPYLNAKQTVERFQLTDKIEVRLGNGLEVLDERVNEVTIAGMGGSLIQTILESEQDQLRHVQKIIAQPNNNEVEVRKTFQRLGFHLTNELIMEENGHIYEILVGERGGVSCYDATINMTIQLQFGPCLMNEKHPLFILKWQRELEGKEAVLKEISRATNILPEKIHAIQEQIQLIKEVVYA